MFCRWCGTQLPENAEKCPKCGKAADLPPDAEHTSRDSVDRVVADATRAARDLSAAAARFTERLSAKMGAAADDPKGAASRAARRVARDLDAAREEIEKALRDL
jgi:ribosomal protein L40E